MAMNSEPPPEQLRAHEQPLRLVALSPTQVAAIRGSFAYYVVMFKVYGLLVSCTAFGWFVHGFARGLLRWEPLESALLGLVAAPLLLMIEAYNLATTMGVPGMHVRRWVTRVVVVTFVFGGVLGQAADRLKDDVDARVAANTLARIEALKVSSTFSGDLKAAQGELQRATGQVSKLSGLRERKLQLDADYAAALSEKQMECDGATSKDGRTRLATCGPKAEGWAAEAQRLTAEATAVQAQINALESAEQTRADAQRALDAVNMAINSQAAHENKGTGVRMAALFQAAREDWGVVFVLAFTLGVYMLPDFIAWLALGQAPGGKNGPEGTYAMLKDLDRKQTDQSLSAFAHRTVQAGARELPIMEVKFANASPRPQARHAPSADLEPHSRGTDREAA